VSPIVGELFDLFFKADTRNVRLLQEYAGQSAGPPGAVWRHWIFVIGAILFLCALFALVAVGTCLLIRSMNHTIERMFGGH
jgi:hypothetical protein